MSVGRAYVAFDLDQVPHGDIQDFLHWFDLAAEFDDDSGTTTPELTRWYEALRAQYQPTPGWDGTKYFVARDFVWARISDAAAEDTARQLARELGVGFYITGDSTIKVELPDGTVIA
ncbi:hypothetical protein [Corynebacterium cystitidis]|uniref:Uncharacterized protein n=1 Tax=Corynebacterium cystitidis DSM 20524 TaxID=1121357 RepID=A0A1H9T7K4_9CORY|nr:hypothetical protein [Corynebacterium cystitidis]WJY83489.1 hypothetical protein CCYS_13020 [Corynebacterium cystitidis DSM 20524]SER93126.1 hypothetical protein SAMN05661109_01346 [Corynebacterium cystitidis DSM 20524]SNV92527.1 Uncharacterised protein [Corynebacterium cystitidis]